MSILEYIEHYQRHIKKNISNRERLYKCIRRLRRLHLTPSLVSVSKVNETVNHLKQFDGKLGKEATSLSRKWIKREAREKKNVTSTTVQENKSNNYDKVSEERQDYQIRDQPIENVHHYRFMKRDFDEVLANFNGENEHHQLNNIPSFEIKTECVSFGDKKDSTDNFTEGNDINQTYNGSHKNDKPHNRRKPDGFNVRERQDNTENFTESMDSNQNFNKYIRNDKMPNRKSTEFKSKDFNAQEKQRNTASFTETMNTNQKSNKYNRNDKMPNRRWSEFKSKDLNAQENQGNTANFTETMNTNEKSNNYKSNDNMPNRRWSEFKSKDLNAQEKQGNTANLTETMNTNKKSNKYNRNDKTLNHRLSEFKSKEINAQEKQDNTANFTETMNTNKKSDKYNRNDKTPNHRLSEFKSKEINAQEKQSNTANFTEIMNTNQKSNKYNRNDKMPNRRLSQFKSKDFNAQEKQSNTANFTESMNTNDKMPHRRWSEVKVNSFKAQEKQGNTANFTERMDTNESYNDFERIDKVPNRRPLEMKPDGFNAKTCAGNFVNFTETVDTNQNLNKYKRNVPAPHQSRFEIKANGIIERVDTNQNHNTYEENNPTSSELHSHRFLWTEWNPTENNLVKGSDTKVQTNTLYRTLEEDLFLSSEEESYTKIKPPPFKKVKKEETPIVKQMYYNFTSASDSDKETISQNSYVGLNFEDALTVIESKQIAQQASANISTKPTQSKYVPSPSKSSSIAPQIETPPSDVSLDNILKKINKKSSQHGSLYVHPIADSQELTEDEIISYLIKSKNNRTKVYSGKNSIKNLPSSQERKIRQLQDHIDDIKFTKGIPSEILNPVLKIATPEQLFTLERHNPYLLNETDSLWEGHCGRCFRGHQRRNTESWRETYIRCKEQQAMKLRSLTKNIKHSQKEKSSVRKTQFVNCPYKKWK